MQILPYVVGYYVFTFQQYIIHTIQHKWYIFKKHKLRHHKTYDTNDITKIVNNFTTLENLDFYFYGNFICIAVNSYCFYFNIIIFQLFLAYISFYLHGQYHTHNSLLKDYKFFKYLKKKHEVHHKNPNKNHFLIDPTFDIIFNTYK